MEIADARRVLRILQAAFPAFPDRGGLPEDTVELYLGVLVGQVASASVAEAVATEWATTQLYFPKPVELLAACRDEARRRKAAEPVPILGEAEPLSTEENARRLAELRESLPALIRKA